MSEPTLFPTTEWTFVIQVIQHGDKDQALQAVARFYERYRTVIAAFFRMHGASEDEAEDLTQDFFEQKILSHNGGLLSRVERDRAKFRTFLRKCLEDFWKDHLRHGGAKKRGDNAPHVPVEEIQATNPSLLPSLAPESEDGYDAAFAERVLELACPPEERKLLQALINETQRRALAAEWDMSEGAVKTALSRFRDRFTLTVRAEVRRTLGPEATEQDVNAEIELLMKALARMAVTSARSPADKSIAGEQRSPTNADDNVSTSSEPGDRDPGSGVGDQSQAP
jgi:RNA polymerase sigma factor (sigma-70 family)